MFSSSERIFWRRSPVIAVSAAGSDSSIWRTDVRDRSLTRISDASEALGSGLPISRPSSPSVWSTMWISFRSYSRSMVGSNSSRGPTIKARVIGTGLNIQGTLELLNQKVNRAFQVPVRLSQELGGAFPTGSEDRLRLKGRRAIGLAQDVFVTRLRLAPQALAELERVSPRVPEDLLPLRLRQGFRASNLAFGSLDFMESFLFLHARTVGENWARV